jgi:hypothetical protein
VNPGTKCNLDVAPVENCREYYKGEGDGFRQVWVVMSLVSSNLLVVRPNNKNVQTIH